MNGSDFHRLDVFIGSDRKIATITIPVGSDTDISWVYEPSWLKDGFPVSPHLPFHQALDPRSVRNFLQNLLPEGQGLEDITSNTKISKNNTFGLIRIIGEDTSGALSFRSPDTKPMQTSFRPVSDAELTNKLQNHQTVGGSITYWDGRTRLSVAGVQDKLNFLEHDGRLGFGEGKLCSNKIFKFESGKVPFIAANELFTMILARNAGIDVPNVEIRSYGDIRAFVIERFDRRYISDREIVQRRHIIDGCQATDLPPSYKYERQYGDEGDGKFIRDGVSFLKLFAVQTNNDEVYRLKLLQWMTFNILTRNYDAHGKNISFFVSKRGLELTPFYDLVNIAAIITEIQNRQINQGIVTEDRSHSISQHYAMSIGGFESGSSGHFQNPITAYMLADFASQFGISLPRIQLVMHQFTTSLLAAIEISREDACRHNLTAAESHHIDLCIGIIRLAADELLREIAQIPDMSDLV